MTESGVVDIYPLTPMQEGMLFHTLLEPESGVYVVQHHGLLEGPLDMDALSASWDQVVERRSVLRSSFEWEELDRPLQVVHRAVHLPLMKKDWTDLHPEDREAHWEQLLRDDRRQGFDLAQAPLMRFVVVQLGPEHYRFLWSHHHILLDGWSLPLLLNEVFSLYEARRRGARLELPAARPFRAYVDWIEGQDQQQARAFWRRRISGYEGAIRLGIDSGVESGEPSHGEETVTLSPAQTTAMEAFCRERQLTLNTLVQGAWALVLSRYSGQRDLVFGEVVSGRSAPLPDIESIVGPLINTLPNRVALDEHMETGEWLAGLQRESAEVRHYEFTPLASIQGLSDLGSGVPLFEYLYAFENYPLDASLAARTGLSLQLRELSAIEQVNYPLALVALPHKEQLRLRAIYATPRFQDWGVRQLLAHVEQALTAFVADPRRPLGAIDLLSPAERARLLLEWNAATTAYASDRCIHEWLEEQVARTPDATAVVCEGAQLTYAQLNRRANRLAHHLRALGVGPESLVGICLERSAEMVVGILGILKAGGAYLPLDPTYPADRLAFMLSDSAARVVVTQSPWLEQLASGEARAVCLDTDAGTIRRQSPSNPEPWNVPENVAYVIYTSGSTGRPKGCLVTHANVTRLFTATDPWYRFDRTDVWTLFHSFAFDFSVWELWGALLYGGRLVVVPYAVSRSPEAFRRLLSDERVTVLNQTPSAFQQLMEADAQADGQRHLALKWVIFGGEALNPAKLAPWFQRRGERRPRLVNMYGITETTVHVTRFPLAADTARQGAASPIGQGIPDLQLYLLDTRMEPVPIGVPGEIHVGGAGVARGYLHRPALTAARFVPHPFGDAAGGRLYRTGDSARWLPDGTLEFLGRVDHQVKIRGFRVEPGEIETVLMQHPAVQETIVLAREDEPGQKRLVSYIVPDEKTAPAVRRWLRLEREGRLKDMARYELPNGLAIVHLNKKETEFTYEEIFERNTYAKHGIALQAGDCVFDVGANIGLFTLFVGQRCRDVKVFAFEPVPQVCELLRRNAELHGLDVTSFCCGLAATPGTHEFTFYPHVSVLSGRFADRAEESQVVKLTLQQAEDPGGDGPLNADLLDAMLEERLQGERISCDFKTVSQVMRENDVTEIGLLKVDVEKSELDVLAGIEEGDWEKIRQVVVEVHDTAGQLQRVVALLEGHGFQVAVEQDTELVDTWLYDVYAVRPTAAPLEMDAAPGTRPPLWHSPAKLTNDVRQRLEERLPVYMVPSAFVTLEALPLTPNGKVDRGALPAPGGARPDLAELVAPRNPTEAVLAEILKDTLGLDQVGVHDNFFALGGDSILGIQVVSRLRAEGFECSPLDLFENKTVAKLAAVVRQSTAPRAEQGEVTGPVELTPVQHGFLDRDPCAPHHFNQSLLFEVRGAIDVADLDAALKQLVAHHDALRLQLSREDGSWRQANAPVSGQSCLIRIDLSQQSAAEQTTSIERICARTQASLDLNSGLLLRGVYFDLGAGRPGRLLLVAHHFAVDGVSWRILLEDLYLAYRQLSSGQTVVLPAKTTSFREWAGRLREYAGSRELSQQVDYWRELMTVAVDSAFPLDRPEGENRVAGVRQVVRTLDGQRTESLLRDVPPVYHTQINDVLLTALIDAYQHWSGRPRLLVDLEGHGRNGLFDDVDVSRTVGWFTSIYPVLLDRADTAGPGELLKSVKEQLRGVPQQGIGYGLLRCFGPEAIRETLRGFPQARVSFNYLGQLDRGLTEQSELFAPADEPKGRDRADEAERVYAVDISGYVAAGRLQLAWQYSEGLSDGPSIEAFADAYVAALERIIEHCLEPEAGGYTPSDFPLARIGALDLDRLAAQVGVIEDLYPLSPTQQGLLFHTLLEPESGVYMVQQHGSLAGGLDMAALSSAWAQTTRRHALLRTSFVWEGLDRPLQVVHPQVRIPLIEEDWTGLSAEEQELRWTELLAADRRRGFTLQQAPLMRFVVARVGAQRYRFLWSQHHLLSDGWSLPLLLKEVFTLYEAHRKGTTPDLPSQPFRNYIAWLEQQDQQQAKSFWQDRLAGFEEPVRLDIDLGGSVPVSVYKEERRELSAGWTQQLEAFARRHRFTVNTVVEAAWALALGRYSRREDVVFGETVSGRSAPVDGIESIVGPLINTLPVRVDLSGTTSVREWLKRLQQQVAELRHYEHTPLMKIQNWWGMGSGRQLFEYLYVFENYPMEAIEQAADQSVEIRDVSVADPTNYPLTLVVAPAARLLLRITYPEHRFSARSIRQLLGHLEQVIREFLRDPEIPLARVSVLTAADREQLLATRNRTVAQHPPGRCIHELFETQAERTPDATAVVAGDEALSYRALERQSNQVAHYLRQLGVGPESLVGICVERSAEMIVGLLGILKAGGAYVPLDPDYPAQRLAFMVQESRADVLLTQHALLDRLPRQGAAVVCLDTDRPLLERQATERPDLLTTPEHPAYVIFTSGSTGRPKGVSLPHRVLTNLITWQLERTSLGSGAATLQYSALSFDVSLQEIFTALCSGGELVLLPHGQARDIESVARWIDARGVQRLFMPFVALGHLADAIAERRNGTLPLKEVITAGEQLQCTPGIRDFCERVGCRLENQYGPSETHVVTAFTLSDTPRDWVSLPPIGGPIANTQAYVLDGQLRAVPVGVAGELYLGGMGLARGYVHRGDLTAERFVPNPFADTPGQRLYRTGDLVRWLPDWNLEFLGRIDQQVKIRGYRIELGEIEAVLSQHEMVRKSVVSAREDQAGHKRLVAYLVPHAEAPAVESLRDHLQRLVPDYMIPQAFVTLENLPLTPSGKVDRKALPAPEGTRPDLASGYVAPRNSTEEMLAQTWEKVLGVDRVGVHDGFFALGGDSILGLQVLSRLRAEGFACTPLQLFQNQTIAELARVVSPAVMVSADQGEITGPIGLTPIQHWFLDTSPAAPHHFNQSLLLELRQRIDPEKLDAALGLLVAHHDALRMRFSRRDGQWQQFDDPVKEVSCLSQVDLSGLGSEAQSSAVEKRCAETQAGMDLDSGLLLRAVYFDLGAERSGRLLLVIHHLVVDGVSWRVLLADLYLAYQGLIRGQSISLPPKTTSFKEWSGRLEEYTRSEQLAAEAPYWLSVQKSAAGVAFPLDSPQGENKVKNSRHVVRKLDREQTETLLRKVPPVYHTQINDVLLAALVDAFRRWSGGEQLLLDLEGHGREELLEAVDVSRTVGWFTILYPVVLKAPEEGDIGGLLKSVKEQLRSIPGRGIGYGVLRYLDGGEVGKALREGPRAKLSFNYLGQLERGLTEQGDLFATATESPGSGRAPEGELHYAVDLSGYVLGERLQMTWRYSENLHTRETMERFADAYMESLQRIIGHCLDPQSGGFTPSDFRLAGLDQNQLDSLVAQVGRRKSK